MTDAIKSPEADFSIHQETRSFGRLPQFVRRVRESVDGPLPRPALFASAISSSAKKESLGSGVVKWYLEMVKSKPVLTKSVTCSIIYTAADLSSQVWDLIKP